MADQDYGAFVGREHVFQRVECVEIEINGRLVEHDDVGGPRQRDRQRKPVAFAARERTDWLAKLTRRKEKVARISRDMAGLAAHDHLIAAHRRERIPDVSVGSRMARV